MSIAELDVEIIKGLNEDLRLGPNPYGFCVV